MAREMTKTELQQRGLAILVRELGYPDTVRFILDCQRRGGDYTKERRRYLSGVSLQELLDESAQIVARAKAKARRKSA
ncbi:hypothetical protein PHYC_03476 [Phycisphaerales bacterium]|nr:hypothetical protein PHYC_03476 [Phycisphaerales bacterium]